MTAGRCCPNRRRLRRAHPGGGAPGCTGRLQLVLLVAVALPAVRCSMSFDDAAPAGNRRHGVRIPAATLRAVAATRSTDVRCTGCAWSLRALLTALARKRRAA